MEMLYQLDTALLVWFFYIIMQDPFPFNTIDVSNEELLNIRLQDGHVI